MITGNKSKNDNNDRSYITNKYNHNNNDTCDACWIVLAIGAAKFVEQKDAQLSMSLQPTMTMSDDNEDLRLEAGAGYHEASYPAGLDHGTSTISTQTSTWSLLITALFYKLDKFDINWSNSLLALILIMLMLTTAIGNLFVIVAILIERNLRTVGNYLVLSLAIADLLVALLVMPLAGIYQILERWTLGVLLCDIWTSADVFCCTASILHLLAIALDRYWAVTRVDYIRCQRSERRIFLMIFFVWLAASIISLAPVFGWKDAQFEWRITNDQECLISQDIGYQIFATCTTFYFPLTLTLIFYWKIYQVARKRIRHKPGNKVKISLQCPSSTSSTSSPSSKQQQQQLQKVRQTAPPVKGHPIANQVGQDPNQVHATCNCTCHHRPPPAHANTNSLRSAELTWTSTERADTGKPATITLPIGSLKGEQLNEKEEDYSAERESCGQLQLVKASCWLNGQFNVDNHYFENNVESLNNQQRSLAMPSDDNSEPKQARQSVDCNQMTATGCINGFGNAKLSSRAAILSSSELETSTGVDLSERSAQGQKANGGASIATDSNTCSSANQDDELDQNNNNNNNNSSSNFHQYSRGPERQPLLNDTSGRLIEARDGDCSNLGTCCGCRHLGSKQCRRQTNSCPSEVQSKGDEAERAQTVNCKEENSSRPRELVKARKPDGQGETNDGEDESNEEEEEEDDDCCSCDCIQPASQSDNIRPATVAAKTTTTTTATSTITTTRVLQTVDESAAKTVNGDQRPLESYVTMGDEWEPTSKLVAPSGCEARTRSRQVRFASLLQSSPINLYWRLLKRKHPRQALKSTESSSTMLDRELCSSALLVNESGASRLVSVCKLCHCQAGDRAATGQGAKNSASMIVTSTTNIAVSTSKPPTANSTQYAQQQAQQQLAIEGMESKRERKAAKTLAIITGVFVICWLPFFVMAITMPLLNLRPHKYVFALLLWLGYFNSMLNPIIYTIFSPDFRKAFKRLLCGLDKRTRNGGRAGTGSGFSRKSSNCFWTEQEQQERPTGGCWRTLLGWAHHCFENILTAGGHFGSLKTSQDRPQQVVVANSDRMAANSDHLLNFGAFDAPNKASSLQLNSNENSRATTMEAAMDLGASPSSEAQSPGRGRQQPLGTITTTAATPTNSVRPTYDF